jgi:hypothetical protein
MTTTHYYACLPLTATDTLIYRLFPSFGRGAEAWAAAVDEEGPTADANELAVQVVRKGMRVAHAHPMMVAAMSGLNPQAINWSEVHQAMRDVGHDIIEEGRQAKCEDYEFQDRAND